MRLTHRSLLLSACLLMLPACGGEPTPEPTPAPIPDPARPFVTSASVSEGARDVYPVELFHDETASTPGIYLRKQLSVTFNTAMKASAAQVTLSNRTDTNVPPRALVGTWSADGRTLLVTVTEPEDGGPPLEEESTYALELTALRGAEADAPLDPAVFLGDGALDFTTSARDGDLEHACAHTLANEPVDVQASAHMPVQGFPPPTDRSHARYRVTLPDAPQGYTELVSKPSGDEDILLYLDRNILVGVHDEAAARDIPVETKAALPVCAGITHVARFSIQGGDRVYFPRFTSTPGSTFEFILERHSR
ncbi:hypothetical protein [Melittangium boletus]|uniref:SbsA Ig-like domain-containing protein n=1 Tax=Melittangium boletus DSM 14713 TaxID=1294270 RepID=A0A250IDP9_9BACT|nr:hypothetical protein [Melittangium boletus]ATB29282.1 hypothetical protein MEBOL_002731 [Melittangium boletus DSM 14713]